MVKRRITASSVAYRIYRRLRYHLLIARAEAVINADISSVNDDA